MRLTTVEPAADPLFGQPIVNVQWSEADALTFAVCLSSLNSSDCTPVCPVSVARGNVILVDHGRSLTACSGPSETLTVPQPTPSPGPCQGPYQPGPPVTAQLPYQPALARSPVTQCQPFPDPDALARRQARAVEAIPEAALAAVRAVIAGLTAGQPLEPDQVQWLTALFGRAAMVTVGLLAPLTARPGSVPSTTDPGTAVAALLAQQETLLDRKLRRLRTLARRARDGLSLGPEVTAEITASWGSAFAVGLDPADPALFGPAAGALGQDPRAALPAVTVTLAGQGSEPLPAGAASVPWTPRRTLLASDSDDRYFVGEADDNGVLYLRFGDGTYGEPPEPGATLAVGYRTGNGTTGNVPAEAITALVSCTTRFGDVTKVRNPLPAQGGSDPEPAAGAQLYAPARIGEPLRRAVTADDYAAVAAADPGLQRAAAQLRWTGSWYEAHVALDPAGTETLEASLARTVTRDLRRVRRLGHDLRVGPAEYVPLYIVMQICVLPGYQRAHVEAALLDLFGTGTTASGQPGFFSPDNLTFGTPVSVSKLVAAAAGVTGVQSAYRHGAAAARAGRRRGARGRGADHGSDADPATRQRSAPSRARPAQAADGRRTMSTGCGCGGAGGPAAGPCAGPSGCGCCQGVQALTPVVIINRPGLSQIAYRAGTYGSFLVTMEAALSGAAEPDLHALRARNLDDPSIAFLDCWATVADVLTFYTERLANEGYLRTATELRSVLELARLTGYQLRPGLGASVYLAYTLQVNPAKVTAVVIGKGARAMSVPGPGQQAQAYETSDDLYAQQTWNTLPIRATTPAVVTEGQLSPGPDPSVSLQGASLAIHPGDRMVFYDPQVKAGSGRVRDVGADGQRRRHRRRDHGDPAPRPPIGRSGITGDSAAPHAFAKAGDPLPGLGELITPLAAPAVRAAARLRAPGQDGGQRVPARLRRRPSTARRPRAASGPGLYQAWSSDDDPAPDTVADRAWSSSGSRQECSARRRLVQPTPNVSGVVIGTQEWPLNGKYHRADRRRGRYGPTRRPPRRRSRSQPTTGGRGALSSPRTTRRELVRPAPRPGRG